MTKRKIDVEQYYRKERVKQLREMSKKTDDFGFQADLEKRIEKVKNGRKKETDVILDGPRCEPNEYELERRIQKAKRAKQEQEALPIFNKLKGDKFLQTKSYTDISVCLEDFKEGKLAVGLLWYHERFFGDVAIMQERLRPLLENFPEFYIYKDMEYIMVKDGKVIEPSMKELTQVPYLEYSDFIPKREWLTNEKKTN